MYYASPYRHAELKVPLQPQQPYSKWARMALVGILGISAVLQQGDTNPRSVIDRILRLPVNHPTRVNATRDYMQLGFKHMSNRDETLGSDALITANELHPSAVMEYNVIVSLLRSLGYQQPSFDPTGSPAWNDIALAELRSDPEYLQQMDVYNRSLATTSINNRLTTLRLVTLSDDQRPDALRRLRLAQAHLQASIARQKGLLVTMGIGARAEDNISETLCEPLYERDNNDFFDCREALMFLRHHEALLPIINEAVIALSHSLE